MAARGARKAARDERDAYVIISLGGGGGGAGGVKQREGALP